MNSVDYKWLRCMQPGEITRGRGGGGAVKNKYGERIELNICHRVTLPITYTSVLIIVMYYSLLVSCVIKPYQRAGLTCLINLCRSFERGFGIIWLRWYLNAALTKAPSILPGTCLFRWWNKDFQCFTPTWHFLMSRQGSAYCLPGLVGLSNTCRLDGSFQKMSW